MEKDREDIVFKRVVKELGLKKEEVYFKDSHLTSLGIAMLTAIIWTFKYVERDK